MKVNKLQQALRKLVTEAAGADARLTKTEAKKLPAYARDRIEAARPSARTKVTVEEAFGAAYGGAPGYDTGIWQDLVRAQSPDGSVRNAVGPSDLSKNELEKMPESDLKELTRKLWELAEADVPAPPADLRRKDVEAAAKLLTALAHKVDNGDGVMTPTELKKAAIQFKGKPDGVAYEALLRAVNRAKNEGSRSPDGVAKVIDEARAEILSHNADGNSTLAGEELKRTRTVLGKVLIAFAQAHKGSRLSDFSTTPEKIYVPTRPFRAPRNAPPETWVQAVTDHFNAFGNDNKGAGTRNISRYVLGTVEAGGVAKEIAKLPLTFRKQVLKALEARVQQDPSAIGDPQRIYLTPAAQPLLEQLAKDARIRCNFAGRAAPPSFNYY